MSSLMDKITEDLKKAMKAREGERVATLRMVIAALKNEKIALRRDLTDDDVVRVLKKGIKSRKEAIDLYRQGERNDLAEKEEREIKILEEYLPEQMTPEEIEKAAAELIKELGIETQKQLGLFMKEFMNRYKGRVDGKLVQQAAKKLLK